MNNALELLVPCFSDSQRILVESCFRGSVASRADSGELDSVIRAPGGKMPIRVITAAAIFDGHDAAIGIFRRILQSQGCEVIHLGHDRGADEVARAAIQEDAHAVAITSVSYTHLTLPTKRIV